MRTKKNFVSLCLLGALTLGNTSIFAKQAREEAAAVMTPEEPVVYARGSTNETTAKVVGKFLRKKLAKELAVIPPTSRQFSFYEVDLNDDGKNEYFVWPTGTYFCGVGGCSIYLLNHNFTVNTYFTVMTPPIFRSSAKTNGWHDLILFGDRNPTQGVTNYIHLKFDKKKKKYPSNPSLVKKIDIAPSGSDFYMWHPDYKQAKTFSF